MGLTPFTLDLIGISSVQDDRLIAKNYVSMFHAGQNVNTAGLLSSYNPSTGTVTFTKAMTGLIEFQPYL